MSKGILRTTLVGIFVYAQFAQAQMSSSSYLIRWDSVNTGGSDTGSSTSYQLRDTLEPVVAGRGTSTSYAVDQGYRGGVFDQVISFTVASQDLSNPLTASALSGTSVTVSSTSGIAVNDYVAVIQNLGASQVSAVGKVSSVSGSTITVDSWTNGGTTPTVDGSNDYVYELNGATVSMSNLSTSSVQTAIVAFDVSVDSTSGYVIQLAEDGEFRSGSNTVDDVADGTVTEATEEYGARSSDTSLASTAFDTSDAAVTATYQDLVTVSSVSMPSRSFVTLKAAVSSTTSSGTYSHILSFIASGNF